jgi:hypothetical protein
VELVNSLMAAMTVGVFDIRESDFVWTGLGDLERASQSHLYSSGILFHVSGRD